MNRPLMSSSLVVATLATVLAGTAAAQPMGQPVDQPPEPAPAATPSKWSIDFGSHIRWLGDTSGAILTSDPLAGARVTIGRSLTQVTAPRRQLDIGLFARWMFGGATGTIFQDLSTNLTQHALTAGARIDAALVWRLRLVAQAEAGMARTALTVTEGAMMPVSDHAWGLYGAASLGTDLSLVSYRRFRLGLTADLGYTVASPVSLRALPGDRPSEDLSIPTTYASIGKLDTRGWTYSMALRGSF